MFDCIDVEGLLKEVEGKQYEKDRVFEFAIKEVKEYPKYNSFHVTCIDQDGDSYTFKFGGEKMSKNKHTMMYSFLFAFFTREELSKKTANPVTLIGKRFEVRSDGQGSYQGKAPYQVWQNNFRKLDDIATVEEFAG
jgi:hypothetical protein